MPKNIAVVSFAVGSPGVTTDETVIRDKLNSVGYSAQLVHQWVFNEPNATNFKKADFWAQFDGVVICSFYGFWTLRELIRANRPVMCLNAGYADDLSLGEREREHLSQDVFNVVNKTHPITAGAGLALGAIDVGNPVWFDSISTSNHHVDVLITTLANQAVLVAHKTQPLSYFGWFRMSQASAGSQLFKLLVQAANWTFSGP